MREGLGISCAFTLLEVLVYIFLFSSISLVLGRLVVMVNRATTISGKKYQKIIKRELCFDIIFRDLVRARSDINYWNSNKIIFRAPVIDVQFFVKKNKLYRRVGIYDFINKRWIKKTSCLVFDNFYLKKLSISLVRSEFREFNEEVNKVVNNVRVVGVFVKWEEEKERYISLRNDLVVQSYCTS